MSRDGSGNYTLPSGNPVVTNTVIASTWANSTLADIAAALTQSLSRDGQTTPTANLTMGNFRLTALGNAVARTDAVAAGQIQDGVLTALTSVSGTDTIIATSAPAITTYTNGQTWSFIAAGTNLTNTVTLNINGLGAKAITKYGANSLNPSDIQNGQVVMVRYDGTQFQMISASVAGFSGKNRFINGDFTVSQYFGSAVVPTPAGLGIYVIDRWQAVTTQASKLTFQQAASPLGTIGHSLSQKITVVSAYTAGSAEVFSYRQPIEAINCADFKWGTADAQPVTMSFWFQSSVTGTYSFFVQNYAANRNYISTISVTAANTPAKYSITIPGDTAGAWAAVGNVGFAFFGFDLGSGTSFASSPNIWQGGNLFKATGSVSFVSNAGAVAYFSGAQLEIGSAATAFEERQISLELMLCQRYAPVFNSLSNNEIMGLGQCVNSGQAVIFMPFKVPARVNPTGVTAAGAASAFYALTTAANVNSGSTAITLSNPSVHYGSIIVSAASLVAGNATQLVALTTSAQISFTGCEL